MTFWRAEDVAGGGDPVVRESPDARPAGEKDADASEELAPVSEPTYEDARATSSPTSLRSSRRSSRE